MGNFLKVIIGNSNLFPTTKGEKMVGFMFCNSCICNCFESWWICRLKVSGKITDMAHRKAWTLINRVQSDESSCHWANGETGCQLKREIYWHGGLGCFLTLVKAALRFTDKAGRIYKCHDKTDKCKELCVGECVCTVSPSTSKMCHRKSAPTRCTLKYGRLAVLQLKYMEVTVNVI